MTLNRALLISVLLIGSTLALLAFGNPQCKYCYLTQKYVISPTPHDDWSFHPTHGFVGHWYDWNEYGDIIQIKDCKQDGSSELIYHFRHDIDRRAEFGIPVK